MSSHRAADQEPAASDCAPPDIVTMRASVSRSVHPVLDMDALATLSATLRGHIEILLPEVEQLARPLPQSDIPRACALACVGEGRRKLRMGDSDLPDVRVSVVEKLGRSVAALCDHYVNLGGKQ